MYVEKHRGHDLVKPARTMWEAARDLVEEAIRRRDAAMWVRGYRLWVQAALYRAPGQPFAMTEYFRQWLPTDPTEGCGRP